jgi:hypothetical protein
MSFELGDGVIVNVAPPSPPTIVAAPPTNPNVAVVVVQGPRGRPGNETDLTLIDARLDALEAEQAAPRGYVHHQNTPATLWQIHHGLPYDPGGVLVLDIDGVVTEFDTISWPAPGVAEITFGVPFSGTATMP